jgi:hypothetical protein
MELEASNEIKSLMEGGYMDAARHRLDEILKTDQHDMQAWLLYVNSFKTIDTRIEVLEICQRLNPGNKQVNNALENLRKKKAAVQSPALRKIARTSSQRKNPDRAEPIPDWRDDLRVKGHSADDLASDPNPLARVKSKPTSGPTRSKRQA